MKAYVRFFVAFIILLNICLPFSANANQWNTDIEALQIYIDIYNKQFSIDNIPFLFDYSFAEDGSPFFSLQYTKENYTIPNLDLYLDYDVYIAYYLDDDSIMIIIDGEKIQTPLKNVSFYLPSSSFQAEIIDAWEEYRIWAFYLSIDQWIQLSNDQVSIIKLDKESGSDYFALFSEEDQSFWVNWMYDLILNALNYTRPDSKLYKSQSLLPSSVSAESSLNTKPSIIKPFSNDYQAINEAAQSMFLVEIYGANDTPLGTGSGFIAFDEHYFVTNHHVIEDAKYLIVVDDNGKEYKVTDLLVADEEKDIAILSFDEASNYRPLPLCATDDLLRGQPIVAIGSPKGVRNTVTTGNISNLIDDNGTHIIQFTAAASPGSSGGAIFNDRGEVIGLMFSKRTDAENMNYAIAISEVVKQKQKNSAIITLAEYNPLINDILTIKNTAINIEVTYPDSSKKTSTSLTFRNSGQKKTITNAILIYGFSESSKNNLLDLKDLNIDSQTTIAKKVVFNTFDKNSSYLFIGIKEITFADGTSMRNENEEIAFYKLDIKKKPKFIDILHIPSGSIAEYELINNEPTKIKVRIQLENPTNDCIVTGYTLCYSIMNPKSPRFVDWLYLQTKNFNNLITRNTKDFSGYFVVDGIDSIPNEIYVGIKYIKLSDGTYYYFEDNLIEYAHWVFK